MLKKYIVTRVYTHHIMAETMEEALAEHDESEQFGDLLQVDEYLLNGAPNQEDEIRLGFLLDDNIASHLADKLTDDLYCLCESPMPPESNEGGGGREQ